MRLRVWSGLLAAGFALAAAAFPMAEARAAEWPQKPVRLIIPFEPGGFTDLSGRTIARTIEQLKLLPQPVVPVNMEGGGGVTGARAVRSAEPDGHTVLIMSIALLGGKARGVVDFGTEAFEPVAIAGESCYVVVVKADAPWKNLKDFLQDAAKRPGEITYGVPIGAAGHMTVLLMEREVPGAKIRVVNTGGSGKSLPMVQGGHIHAHTSTAASYLNYGPSVRALGLIGPARIPAAPDLPTTREQGIDVEMCLQNGFYMPKGSPKAAVDTLANALEKVVASKEFHDSFKDGTFTFTFLKDKALEAQLEKDRKKVDSIAADLRGQK